MGRGYRQGVYTGHVGIHCPSLDREPAALSALACCSTLHSSGAVYGRSVAGRSVAEAGQLGSLM